MLEIKYEDNISKTEIMKIDRRPMQLNIYINYSKIKQICEFTYLGSIPTEEKGDVAVRSKYYTRR